MSELNNFEKLAAIDVNEQIEKKNGLSYLSWAWAVDRLLRADPAATWHYSEPVMFGQTMMVVCTVTAHGKPMTMQLPVMDFRNKAIANPDAFAVNTAMQRCLVKAIALHGLGLYIYAGEDLPYDESKADKEEKVVAVKAPNVKAEAYEELDADGKAWVDNLASEVTKLFNEGFEAKDLIKHIKAGLGDPTQNMTPDEVADYHRFKLAVWSRLDSPVRSAIDKVEKGISSNKTRKDDAARAAA